MAFESSQPPLSPIRHSWSLVVRAADEWWVRYSRDDGRVEPEPAEYAGPFPTREEAAKARDAWKSATPITAHR